MKRNKLVIVGVGHVGSYVLADAMKIGLFSDIALIDINNAVATGEVMVSSPTRARCHIW